MAYDDNAKKVVVKAIGTVESNLNYLAVNYNDPITVGFMQWYGTRAAALLGRIRSQNAGSWVGVESSLTAALDTHPANDSNYWTNRYLTRAEGESLKPVLNNNKSVQNAQAFEDLGSYEAAAASAGIDLNTNTNMGLLFFVAYHQSPRRALQVVAAVGPSSSMDRYLAGLLNEPVLGQYRTRYNTAAGIIRSGDSSGVDDTPGTAPEPELPGGDPGSGAERPAGPVKHVKLVGDNLHITFKDGGQVFAYPTGAGTWITGLDKNVGAPLPPPVDNGNPSTPGGGSATQQALVEFVTSRIGRYAYSQGPTRLEPERNMYTDCSGLMYFAFQSVMGINIGTYTGNQWDKGTLVTQGSGTINEALLQPGDLVFFDWRGGRTTVDHVDMYIGSCNVCGHGGPGSGPNTKPLAERVAGAVKYVVRRHA